MAKGNRVRRAESDVEGVLLVDKPVGPTSFDIIAKARRALNTRAIGHTGTLDPLAEGLLVLLVGRYTRLSAHLVADDKVYAAQVCFGQRTNTDDREGEAVEVKDASGLREDAVRAAIAAMVGKASQVPPAFSAISVGGERLYKKARRGEEVEVPPRDVEFYRLDVTGYDATNPAAPTVDVTVSCSKGTYIRAFARDLGTRVGVPAYLSKLRRISSGEYAVDAAVTLDALQERGASVVARGASAVRGIQLVAVTADEAAELTQGRAVDFVDDDTRLKPWADGAAGLAHVDDAPIAIVKREGDRFVVTRGFGPAPKPA